MVPLHRTAHPAQTVLTLLSPGARKRKPGVVPARDTVEDPVGSDRTLRPPAARSYEQAADDLEEELRHHPKNVDALHAFRDAVIGALRDAPLPEPSSRGGNRIAYEDEDAGNSLSGNGLGGR